jgi:hypothetical protein
MKPTLAAAEQAIAAASASALEGIAANALRLLPQHAEAIMAAKLRRLAALHAAAPGDLDAEAWRMAVLLRAQQGRKLMANSRSERHVEFSIREKGAEQAVRDMLARKPGEGFALMVQRGLADFTAEAIVLRFPETFGPALVEVAQARLAAA